MTIRKGEAWGESVPSAPAGLRIAANDREATAGPTDQPVGLRGGDMARTMGAGGADRLQGPHVRATVDLLEVRCGDTTHTALAHVVARRSWWRGTVVLAMNAQFLGQFDVAPRSHPNDGRVDVVVAQSAMPLRARWQARTRALTGTHLPHPQLTVSSTATWSADFPRPLYVYVDGHRVGRTTHLEIAVRPDALTVHA